ncbi:MAG: hypothetical protein QXD43_02920 [Candidatus Aenigmatarchaeota archaeon]
MSYLKSIDEDATIKLLYGLSIFEDHCERSQLAFKDFEKNKGILTKFIEYVKGRSERTSHLSGFCTECADVLAGGNNIGIVLICELVESLKPYKKDVQEIQETCIHENCEEALEKVKKLKEKVLNNYLSNKKGNMKV